VRHDDPDDVLAEAAGRHPVFALSALDDRERLPRDR
jgi:hypothetical protein